MNHYNFSDYTDIDFNIKNISLVREKICHLNWCYEEKEGRHANGIVYVTGGGAEFIFSDGEKMQVEKNDVFFLQKGCKYVTKGSSETEYRFITIAFELDNGENIFNLPFQKIYKSVNPNKYFNLFNEIENNWYYMRLGYKIKCKIMLLTILHLLIEENLSNHMNINEYNKLLPAISYIENNYDRHIPIEQLTAITSLSPTHFRRIFKKVFNTTPVEFINNLRINQAKSMILSRMYSFEEISEKTGFFDVSYFSRVFKNITGSSPSDFRNFNP